MVPHVVPATLHRLHGRVAQPNQDDDKVLKEKSFLYFIAEAYLIWMECGLKKSGESQPSCVPRKLKRKRGCFPTTSPQPLPLQETSIPDDRPVKKRVWTVSADVVYKFYPTSADPPRQTPQYHYNAFNPPRIRVPFRMVDYRVQSPPPGLCSSSVITMDSKLCRENFEVIMNRMYYKKLMQNELVEIQFIKKVKSALNRYCLWYGKVLHPIYDLPDTMTVFIRLENMAHGRGGRIVRVPLDHFRIC